MLGKKLICKTHVEEEKVSVLCPSVGFLKLMVKPNQVIDSTQTIGRLRRLGRIFTLNLPPDCTGRVINNNNSQLKIAPVSFGQQILLLDARIKRDEEGEKRARDIAESEESAIVAPMDGMFYLSPSPTDPPFVSLGQKINPGQTIGLIEVMKCFYPVLYEGQKSATITAVIIENATPVNCGTKIYTIAD